MTIHCACAELDPVVFETDFEKPLGELDPQPGVLDLFSLGASAPVSSSDDIRAHVRDVLRASGFKPTGRSKPASEYLLRSASEGKLTSINAAVDVCNAVSLHSGLPISVIDFARADRPFAIRAADEGAEYVFNSAGQTIDVAKLVCLFDASGPCANPVKDAQRTKTSATTSRTLTVIWGAHPLPGYADRVFDWYVELLRPHRVSRIETAV
jgi:DNA/RNA-binding domain of Phe-tRNA-synthetase-like protein